MVMLKQKRHFFYLLFLGLIIYSCVENDSIVKDLSLNGTDLDVSEEMATTVAQNFSSDQAFLNNPEREIDKSALRSSRTTSKKEIKEILTFKSANGFPVLYVVQFERQGFVIVSGSKKVTPILAFSETGTFEYDSLSESSGGLKDWIESRKLKIELLKTVESEILEETVAEWDYFAPPPGDEEVVSGGTANEQEGPLLNTRWDQGCGFNDLLATCTTGGSCGRVLTGCVATATAQVMRHWELPNSYNWASMPNFSGSAETSLLMKDIGEAVNMDYGCNGSGAITSEARNALVNTFGYSSNASYVNYNTSTLITQLDAGWPVILRGEGTNGHAWVCEGYRRNKFISIHNPGTHYEYETYTYSPLFLWMNWGWLNGTANT